MVKLDCQVPRATQSRIRAVRWRIADEPEILQPPGKFGQRYLRLNPG
jgi:hypothetical protein